MKAYHESQNTFHNSKEEKYLSKRHNKNCPKTRKPSKILEIRNNKNMSDNDFMVILHVT